MTYVQFVFVGEGGIDNALVDHIEDLLIWVGALEVFGSSPDLSRLAEDAGRDVESKLRAITRLETGANLILIHRDADSPDSTPRREEIEDAVDAVGVDRSVVPVVPVQETEAWALLDEDSIKRAAGNPNSTADLDLPGPHDVEAVANPKEKLHEALRVASGTSGRRRERFNRRIPNIKAHLLRGLPVDGPVQDVPAWQQLRDDLEDAIEYL